MKKIVVLASCVAAGFVGALLMVWFTGHHSTPQHQADILPVESPRPEKAAQTATPAPPPRFDWRNVESPDYRIYIKNLRATGCPEQTVRDIIMADVNALFDSREKESPAWTNRFEYWNLGAVLPRQWITAKLTERHNQFEPERVAILKELLGNKAPIESRAAKISDDDINLALLDFVPPEERMKAVAVISETETTFQTEFNPHLGQMSDQNRKDYTEFFQAREAKLLEALGEQRKEDYDLRNSQLAGTLRFMVQGIDLTEDEFRELFRFAKPMQMTLDFFTPGTTDETLAARKLLQDKVRQLVGDQRVDNKVLSPFESQFGLGKR